jgi:polyhydroxyalkanoate synthase
MSWLQSLTAGLPQVVPQPASLPSVHIDPERLKTLQQDYLREWTALAQEGGKAALLPDRRFAAPAWAESALSSMAVAHYQLNAHFLHALADAVETDAKTQARIRFAVEQWVAASAPSNALALNAEALRKAVETQGESIAQGLKNLLDDLRQGHLSMTDERQFEVGRNVATTEGAVVFENELFQLIEYKPLTETVYERPLLLVPPCINKYYILDLQPANSLIRYAVAQGHRTFVVSWRNADESLAEKTWDDYIESAVMEAIAGVRKIAAPQSGRGQINALGFCVGGTMLGTALAVLAARGEEPVHSATFLTTFLDFHDTGILDVFIDEASVALREKQMGNAGLMRGRDLAATFSFLRPDDLVWNYVVGNYLKGETPPPFDLLYWNCDSTNLPGPFYAWYLRNTYLENNLAKPGHTPVCGEKVDFRLLNLPTYFYGSREDHIVPATSAYLSVHAVKGKKRFVLGASGHIAGVINPPEKKKRSHWVSTDGKLAEERPGGSGQLVDRLGELARGASWQANCCTKKVRKGNTSSHRSRPGPLCEAKNLNLTLEEWCASWKTSLSFQRPARRSASLAARWPKPRPRSWAPSPSRLPWRVPSWTRPWWVK